MAKYRYRTKLIDATQFKVGEPLPDGVIMTATRKDDLSMGNHAVLRTLEGDLHVCEGDWIVTDEAGRQMLYPSDMFCRTFEKEN